MEREISILLVEDEPALRDLATLALRRAFGGQVRTAASGKEALERLEEARPEVVILDILLPQMNGLELIQRIRDLEGSGQPAVIVTSALGYQEIVRQAVAAGAVDFIIKPYDVDVLVERVRQALLL